MSGQLFIGVTDATMTHGEAWHFCRLGRLLERADKTSRILDVKYFILLPKPTDVGTPSTTSSGPRCCARPARSRCIASGTAGSRPVNVVEFLMLDREFPRAVLLLPDAGERIAARDHRHAAGQLSATPPSSGWASCGPNSPTPQVEEIIAGGLHEFVDDLQTRLNDVGEAIYETFFAMRPLETMATQRQTQFQQFKLYGTGH